MHILVKVLDKGFSLLGVSLQSSGVLQSVGGNVVIQRGFELRIGLIFLWIELFIPFGGSFPLDDVYKGLKTKLRNEEEDNNI